jgi:hypothetical protein
MTDRRRLSRSTSLALVALTPALVAATPYDANPTLGAPGSPVIDGTNDGEWGPEHLIYRGLANDDPRSLGGNWTMHETPWDLTHLFAAWDDNALYLAWQYVDVTDIVDPANAGSAGGSSPGRMDLIQWIALDTVSGRGAALDMWGKNAGEPYWTGPDLRTIRSTSPRISGRAMCRRPSTMSSRWTTGACITSVSKRRASRSRSAPGWRSTHCSGSTTPITPSMRPHSGTSWHSGTAPRETPSMRCGFRSPRSVSTRRGSRRSASG